MKQVIHFIAAIPDIPLKEVSKIEGGDQEDILMLCDMKQTWRERRVFLVCQYAIMSVLSWVCYPCSFVICSKSRQGHRHDESIYDWSPPSAFTHISQHDYELNNVSALSLTTEFLFIPCFINRFINRFVIEINTTRECHWMILLHLQWRPTNQSWHIDRLNSLPVILVTLHSLVLLQVKLNKQPLLGNKRLLTMAASSVTYAWILQRMP